MKGVLLHQENAPALKIMIPMATKLGELNRLKLESSTAAISTTDWCVESLS